MAGILIRLGDEGKWEGRGGRGSRELEMERTAGERSRGDGWDG